MTPPRQTEAQPPTDARITELERALRAAPFGTLLQMARTGLESIENVIGRPSANRDVIEKCDAALAELFRAAPAAPPALPALPSGARQPQCPLCGDDAHADTKCPTCGCYPYPAELGAASAASRDEKIGKRVTAQVIFMAPDECVRRIRAAPDAEASDMLRTLEHDAYSRGQADALPHECKHCVSGTELRASYLKAESAAYARGRTEGLREAEQVCKALSASPRGNDYGSIGGAYDDCADSIGALAVGSAATEAQPPLSPSGALAGAEEMTTTIPPPSGLGTCGRYSHGAPDLPHPRQPVCHERKALPPGYDPGTGLAIDRATGEETPE